MTYNLTRTRTVVEGEIGLISVINTTTLEHEPVAALKSYASRFGGIRSALEQDAEILMKVVAATIDGDDPRQAKIKRLFGAKASAEELKKVVELKYSLFEITLLDIINNPDDPDKAPEVSNQPNYSISNKLSAIPHHINGPHGIYQDAKDPHGLNLQGQGESLALDHLNAITGFTAFTINYNFGSEIRPIGRVIIKKEEADRLFPNIVKTLHVLNNLEEANAALNVAKQYSQLSDKLKGLQPPTQPE